MKKYLTVSCVLALSVSAVSAQSLYPGMFTDKIKVETKAPSSVTPLPLSDVRLLEGRFKDNMDRDARWISKIDVDRLLHSFYNNAGVYAGREGGYMTVKKYGGWESLDCELRGHTGRHLPESGSSPSSMCTENAMWFTGISNKIHEYFNMKL